MYASYITNIDHIKLNYFKVEHVIQCSETGICSNIFLINTTDAFTLLDLSF